MTRSSDIDPPDPGTGPTAGLSSVPGDAWIAEAFRRDWDDPHHWRWNTLADIDARSLLDLLILRSRVFVVEQHCIYLDPDEKDIGARFLHASCAGQTVATVRVLDAGMRFAEPSIGRVCVAPELRRTGLGRALMREALRGCSRYFPGASIRISAQAYLGDFYRSFGFVVVSEPYLEDDIDHVEMLLRPLAPGEDDGSRQSPHK